MGGTGGQTSRQPSRPDARVAPDADGRLRLAATDRDDLAVLSAVMQDALVPVKDLRWLPPDRCFVAVLNRFKWETADATRAADGCFERVLCSLTVNGVGGVKSQGVPLDAPDRLLCLLQIAAETLPDGTRVVDLRFADAASIRLSVASIQVHIEDLCEPWPTQWRPVHAVTADTGPARTTSGDAG